MPGSNATGLMLALLTALFWGALPLALKHLLSTVDALSIVCLRFWVAAAWTWGLSCRHPGNSTPLGRREKVLLALAAAGLSCNFVFFNSSVAYLSASACQILAQAGPVLLLLGSVFVLREPFLPIQGGASSFCSRAFCCFSIPGCWSWPTVTCSSAWRWGSWPPSSGPATASPRKSCCARSRPGASCVSSILPVPWP